MMQKPQNKMKPQSFVERSDKFWDWLFCYIYPLKCIFLSKKIGASRSLGRKGGGGEGGPEIACIEYK